ncbi:MAG TPA: c-type cytochrome [Polyangiaceae bacterium]|nr:c-type cytochrome [Polyangiaceae bacterium]
MKTRRLVPSFAVLGMAIACKRAPSTTEGHVAVQPSSSARPSASAGAPRSASPLAPATPGATTWPGPLVAEGPPPSTDRGRELYGRMCAVCHGAHGEGYRADSAPALANPNFLATVNDEFLDFAIAIGRARTPMSAWRTDQGGPLSPSDVKSIIAFMRTWPATKVTMDERFVSGDPARGKVLFNAQCASCHGPHGTAVHILSRQWLTQARVPFIRYAITNGRPPTPMKGFAATLGDKGIEDVIGYLRSLPSWLVPGEIAGSSRPPPIPLGPVPLNPHGPAPKGFQAYPRMTSLTTIWRELERGATLALIDARAPSDYGMLHIANAVSVPFYDPTPYLDALPKTAWLVCYCECPHAESGALAQQLLEAGFTKVTVLDEGFRAWRTAGHPTHTGTTP